MADVFISYKREDKARAEQVASALEQLGFDVWWDFELLSGDQYRKVIREVINQCKAAVVLWSKLAVESDFVLDEASHAKSQGKLCPAMIDEAAIPLGFGQLHTDNLTHWGGEMGDPGFTSLLRGVEAKTGKKARLGMRPRDASGERQFAELEDFKAAQIAATPDALSSFLRSYPAGAFSAFVRSQLDGGPAPSKTPTASAASAAQPNASLADVAPAHATKSAPRRGGASVWPVALLATLAVLIGGGAGIYFGVIAPAAAREEAERADREHKQQAEAAALAKEREQLAEERAAADDSAWAAAKTTNSAASMNAYVSAFPNGRHLTEAQQRIETIRIADARAAEIAQANAERARPAEIQRKEQAAEAERRRQQQDAERAARDRADDAAYAIAKGVDSVGAYDQYLQAYVYGRHAQEAREAKAKRVSTDKQNNFIAGKPVEFRYPNWYSGVYNLNFTMQASGGVITVSNLTFALDKSKVEPGCIAGLEKSRQLWGVLSLRALVNGQWTVLGSTNNYLWSIGPENYATTTYSGGNPTTIRSYIDPAAIKAGNVVVWFYYAATGVQNGCGGGINMLSGWK